jgi:diamine N-acetyltransferase
MVELLPATDENRAALEGLRMKPGQEEFINSVAEAFLEAEEEAGGRAIQFGVYDGEELVGFVMLSDEVDGPPYVAHYLWKLLIDARYQGQGYGTAALGLVADYFRARGVDAMWTSATDGDGSPISFYLQNGFVATEPAPWGEMLFRLDL